MPDTPRIPDAVHQCVARAQASHGMYEHLANLADRCAQANEHDPPRWIAALRVRDYCRAEMQQVWMDLAAALSGRADAADAAPDTTEEA
jgi:hypothetical protein